MFLNVKKLLSSLFSITEVERGCGNGGEQMVDLI